MQNVLLRLGLALIITTAFIGGLVALALSAQADPAVVEAPIQTASATTSPVYMTAGTATTTLTYPPSLLTYPTYKPTEMALNVQLAGSSTASSIDIEVQHSRNGIDWYPESLAWNTNETATTSPSLGGVRAYTFGFASSTINKVAVTNANSATSSRMLLIDPVFNYVRVLVSMPAGSAPGAVYAELVPIREN